MNRIIERLRKQASVDIIQELNGTKFNDIGTIGNVTSEIMEEREIPQTRWEPGEPGYLGCTTGAIFTVSRSKLENKIGRKLSDQDWETAARALYSNIMQDPVNNFYNIFGIDIDDMFNKAAEEKFTGDENWDESYNEVTNDESKMEIYRCIDVGAGDFPDTSDY